MAKTTKGYLHYNEPFPTRIRSLLADTNTTAQALGEHLGISQQAVNLYAFGESKPTLDKLVKIANRFGVTTDYLLGLSDVSKPDISAQAASVRYGLTGQALEALERLNTPYNVESSERVRILKVFERGFEYKDHPNENYLTISQVWEDELKKQALSILSDMLSADEGLEESYGMRILNAIYDYCRREFVYVKQPPTTPVSTSTGITSYMQRQCKLLELNQWVKELRDKLTGKG
jgi:transcriptional regulator with XRE-family HTH domain